MEIGQGHLGLVFCLDVEFTGEGTGEFCWSLGFLARTVQTLELLKILEESQENIYQLVTTHYVEQPPATQNKKTV